MDEAQLDAIAEHALAELDGAVQADVLALTEEVRRLRAEIAAVDRRCEIVRVEVDFAKAGWVLTLANGARVLLTQAMAMAVVGPALPVPTFAPPTYATTAGTASSPLFGAIGGGIGGAFGVPSSSPWGWG